MRDESSCELVAVFEHNSFSVRRAGLNAGDGFFDDELLKDFETNKYLTLFNFGFMAKPQDISPSLEYLHLLASVFICEITRDGDIEISGKAAPVSEETALQLFHSVPFALGMENIGLEWIRGVWGELSAVFKAELEASDLDVQSFFQGKNQSITLVGRVYFHLVENREGPEPFAFLATYSTGTSERVRHLPLKNALLEYKDETHKLLQLLKVVGKVSDKSSFISNIADSGEIFSPLLFSREDAYTFLSEIPVYSECGIICRIPQWWKKRTGLRISARVGDKKPAGIGLEEILSFEPRLTLDGVELTKEEAGALLEEMSGLTLIKGKWVEVDPKKLKAAIAMLEKTESCEGLSLAGIMQLQMGMEKTLPRGAVPFEVENGAWLEELRGKMLSAAKRDDVKPSKYFKAQLREYQKRGFGWLFEMYSMGFGALLADDMGLGKTVQVLALLDKLKSETLLVIPTSLICNWVKECERFAPQLKVKVIHGKNSVFEKGSAQLYITTYGMLQRNSGLTENYWDIVVIDEAQAIKNSGSKQSRAVRALKARAKIALTGTPVENRLSDLWSIFDFLNPGMLGSAKEFKDFTKKLKEDATGYGRLKQIISPFILRRLKTDKKIIKDLPDKIEVKELTGLSKKQAVLYEAVVKEVYRGLSKAEGVQRSGLVLSSIVKLKQICNHGDLFLGGAEFDPQHSGKLQMLRELCETISEKQERVLVFTQFKEMTEPLADFLEGVFGQKGLVLHGGTPVSKRGKLVESFGGEAYVPFMVLSLKAGGVGLNLTGANHVIHFDRWWNPAVENQATDRAFRIGQQKNVMVHKFITAGTIEEKIDNIIEEKQGLADQIVAEGESSVTKLSNSELMELMRLEA